MVKNFKAFVPLPKEALKVDSFQSLVLIVMLTSWLYYDCIGAVYTTLC